MEENLSPKAKTKANLKPDLKMKLSKILVTKNLAGGKMKSANENYFTISLENLEKFMKNIKRKTVCR